MSLAAWSVKNRVAVNLLTLLIIVAGWMAATSRLKLDLFPDISTNFIQVTTLDPATGSAEEIERTITVPIEEELGSVRGLKQVQSISEDNFSNIFIEVEAAITDIDPVLNEVRQAVDKARGKLPPSVESPVIEEFDIPFPLITFTVSMPPDADPMAERPRFEALERRLRIIPGVSAVLVDGLDRREVWIETDPYRAAASGISFADIRDAVARANINAVSGRFDATGGERSVRVLGEISDPSELADIPVKTRGGSFVLLRDIATFRSRTEEPRTIGRTDMLSSVTFTVVRKKGADAIKTVAKAREVFAAGSAELPKGYTARALLDSTRFIKVRLNTVVSNGIQALLLVTVLLMLFLNWRLAILVAIGIPVSFAGCLLVLYAGGYSINMLSLFGMIMALGMVVDDAIVMAENSYRWLQKGLPPHEAAIRGSEEVFWPVVGSVSTTVAAFLPLIWAEGIIGKVLMIVPVVVISALVVSLLQAFLVLPSHMADFVRRGRTASELALLPPPRSIPARLSRACSLAYRDLRDFVDSALRGLISLYMHLLAMGLRWRYFVLTIFVAMLVGGFAIIGFGLVPFRLFSTDFADTIFLKAELPADYSLDQTSEAIRKVERRIAELLPKDDLLSLITRIGARYDATNQFLEYGTNLALITVDIDEENPLCRRPSEISRALRKMLPEFPEFVELTVMVDESGPPVGRPVNVELSGSDLPGLLDAARSVEDRLRAVPGVYNIGNDFPRGRTELRVKVDEARAAELGVDTAHVSSELQGAFFGLEADRMRWGNEEVILRVKGSERFTQAPEFLRNFRIQRPDGTSVAIGSVAEITRTTGISRIKRTNQERVVSVSADIDTAQTTSAAVNKDLQKWLKAPGKSPLPDNVVARLSGESEDTERSLSSMLFAAVVALGLIYALLAIIGNAFLQPFVIMATIPFGITGVIFGLLVMGQPIGLMAIMGTVALAGIVVNNAVVFVDFINQYRKENEAASGGNSPALVRWRSIFESASSRFRPVFLTTATTVVGLMNLAFTSTGQEQFLAPMAQAIVFGLSFASLITLLLIPCLYSILDDIIIGTRKLLAPRNHI